MLLPGNTVNEISEYYKEEKYLADKMYSIALTAKKITYPESFWKGDKNIYSCSIEQLLKKEDSELKDYYTHTKELLRKEKAHIKRLQKAKKNNEKRFKQRSFPVRFLFALSHKKEQQELSERIAARIQQSKELATTITSLETTANSIEKNLISAYKQKEKDAQKQSQNLLNTIPALKEQHEELIATIIKESCPYPEPKTFTCSHKELLAIREKEKFYQKKRVQPLSGKGKDIAETLLSQQKPQSPFHYEELTKALKLFPGTTPIKVRQHRYGTTEPTKTKELEQALTQQRAKEHQEQERIREQKRQALVKQKEKLVQLEKRLTYSYRQYVVPRIEERLERKLQKQRERARGRSRGFGR